MKRSKLTERCALGHPDCSHTYGGKCYSLDMQIRDIAKLPEAIAAHILEDPGHIPDDDPIRVNAVCHECYRKGFRIRSEYGAKKLPPLYVVTASVVHTHVHRFDPGLNRWIIEEEVVT